MDNSGSITVAEGSSNAWTCKITTHNSDPDGASTFSIAFSDDANNAGTTVADVTDSSSVTIDNTHPGLSSVAATDSAYGVGETLSITVTYDEIVDVTGTPTLALSNSETATYSSGTGSTALVFTYTVTEGDSDSSDLSVS